MLGLPLPPWAAKAAAYSLAALALVLIGRQWGASSVYEEWIAANASAAVAAVKVVQTQQVVTERVVTQYRDRLVEVRTAGETIEKEVIRYVESKPLALACLLDPRWVQLHDAAAAGSLPPPAGGSDAAGTTATEALPTITANYATYHEVSARLTALQAWVREQYEATNGGPLGY